MFIRAQRKIPGTIIGIVKDFHSNSLHSKIEPLVIGMYIGKPWFISVKINPAGFNETIKKIREKMNNLFPDKIFEYKTVKEDFENQYIAERRMSKLYEYFSFFMIFISCLGLFGLVSISVEQHRKEIGIRKVLGASTAELTFFFLNKYLSLIISACVIVSPLTYLIMNKWLDGFAYRININLFDFIIAGFILSLFVLATVIFKIIKIARTNPVESLRYE